MAPGEEVALKNLIELKDKWGKQIRLLLNAGDQETE